MLPASFCLALTFWIGLAFPDSDADKVFAQGVESFKRSELAQSKEAFSQLIKTNPADPQLLYNLGLIEYKDSHPGRALAYWRKALYLSPGYGPAMDGINTLLSKRFPALTNVSWLQKLYWRVSATMLCLVALPLLFFGGLFLVRRLYQKKMQQPSSLGAPSLCLIFGFALLALATHNLVVVHQTSSATILAASAPAHSSPNEESPSLFDFKEGDEVSVRRSSADWLQVQKSTTSIGWVKKDQLFLHSGNGF